MHEIELKGHEGITFRVNDGKLPRMFFFLELTNQSDNPPEMEYTLASAVKLNCLSKKLANEIRKELGIKEEEKYVNMEKNKKVG